jgi:hypothetical protein
MQLEGCVRDDFILKMRNKPNTNAELVADCSKRMPYWYLDELRANAALSNPGV